MFNKVGLAETCEGERYASDAPMSAVPLVASVMPVPEPVPAVEMVTFE